jgi:hypothetical protein
MRLIPKFSTWDSNESSEEEGPDRKLRRGNPASQWKGLDRGRISICKHICLNCRLVLEKYSGFREKTSAARLFNGSAG